MYERPTIVPPIPAELTRTAKAVFGDTNFYMLVGDRIGSIFSQAGLEHLLAISRNLHTSVHILPLITFFQFIEGLTDEQAAHALHVRTDWQYALHLHLPVLVIPDELLCLFRFRLVTDPLSQLEFQALVEGMIQLGPPGHHKPQEYLAMPMLSAICALNCLAYLKQILAAAMEALAIEFPQELRHIALPDWYGRYSSLASSPDSTSPMRLHDLWIRMLDQDIPHLLREVDRSNHPGLKKLPQVRALRQAWREFSEGSSRKGGKSGMDFALYDCDSCINHRRRAAAA